uniref:BAH domain-containing protein n=1 Tax=Steinernema glaseri TaxID=37863 RepID=A0A1I7ZX89_9BILA
MPKFLGRGSYDPANYEANLRGIVVTSPIRDEFVGAVFVDPDRPLYLMHKNLFILRGDPCMTRSRHIRMEEFFEFGEVITFIGCNGFMMSIEKVEQKTAESFVEDQKHLVETICVFRYTEDNTRTTVYSTTFGIIDFDTKALGGVPAEDVAIRCFVNVDYEDPNTCNFTAVRFKCIEPEDAPLVTDTPWHKNRVERLPIYDDDDDAPVDPLGLRKSSEPRQDILYKKQGRICQRKRYGDPIEVRCPAFKRERFIIGFLLHEHNDIEPGRWIKFDAFWNPKTNCYIINQYEVK